MDLEFFSTDSRLRTLVEIDLMSGVSKPISSQMVSVGAAANADQLGDVQSVAVQRVEATGGWDAYDVWRRFIKEARDRRKTQDQN